MNAPGFWGVLGISPTNDLAAIRKAYAERLKVTNPEDNPEGFKQLRSSYEMAMRQARWVRPPSASAQQNADAPGEEFGDDDFDLEDEAFLDDEFPDVVVRDMPGTGADPRPVDEAPARERTPAELDRAEHRRLAAELERLLYARADADVIAAAFEALVASPAMDQVSVYAQTESSMIWLIHNNRPASDVLIEPAIAKFNWVRAAQRVRDGGGAASILELRKVVLYERASEQFIERIRDKRHEFNPAFRELSRPMEGRSWFARIWALRRFGRVRRFVDYFVDRAPLTERLLDASAMEWWRKQLTKSISPLWAWDAAVKGAVGLIIIAGFVMFMPSKGGSSPPLAEGPLAVVEMNIRQARETCRVAVTHATASYADESGCRRAAELAPDSLMVTQYLGLMALGRGHSADAEQAFVSILQTSPVDPYALFGKGLALSSSGETARVEEGRSLMRQALAADTNVSAYFAEFGVLTPTDLGVGAEHAPSFTRRPVPDLDTAPHRLNSLDQSVFDEAYAYFGIVPGQDGRVELECLVHRDGGVRDCLVMQEEPRNQGMAEIAIRVIGHVQMAPALLEGAPVDNVPLRFPVRFSNSPNTAQ